MRQVRYCVPRLLGAVLALLLPIALAAAAAPAPTNTFVVAAYNLENWLTMERRKVPDLPKPESEKAAVLQLLTQVAPDVLGVIELGTRADFEDLADRLAKRGLVYPHREWIQGADQERHVALLSKFPIVARNPQTNLSYDTGANTLFVSRGFLDVTIAVNDHYRFRAVLSHLKSKRVVEEGDQAAMRVEEGRLLHQHLATVQRRDPQQNLLLLGDLNDTPESEVIRLIIHGDPFPLVDLLPVDRHGGHHTYQMRYQKIKERIDYLLPNPAMHAEYVPGSARIADFQGWWNASDHRAISARFTAADAPSPSAALPAPEPGPEQLAVSNSLPVATKSPSPTGGLSSRARLIIVVVVVFLASDLMVLWWLFQNRPGRS